MHMDYSKLFELQNQGAEKERNEKAEKAVYDNLYNKGYRDGIAALDKLRERIELEKLGYPPSAGYYKAIMKVLDIIDKYRAESENKK